MIKPTKSKNEYYQWKTKYDDTRKKYHKKI